MTMSAKRKIVVPTPENIDDVWKRRATASAIQAVRKVITGGTIPPAMAISKLSDIEIGWLVAAGLFGWIRTRAEQATAEGWDIEETLQQTSLVEPWDAGAVTHILPELGALSGFDWDRPIGAWPKDMIVGFVLAAVKLTSKAMTARDVGGSITVTKCRSLDEMQRIAAGEAGGSLTAPGEFDDPIPF
jgi:hypothetical protein